MPESVLILTGFMGSGKTTVGIILAKLRGYRFVDLDAEIVDFKGCSINEIFARDGEQAFRALESTQLEQFLSAANNCVIATGGGAVLSEHNRKLMRDRGVVINLKVTLQQVMKRLQGCGDRPLLAGDGAVERAKTMIKEREQYYSDADIRIDTDGKSVEDVAAEILGRLEGLSA